MSSSADCDFPAVYIGTQPGFRNIPAIELYNLLQPVGEHPPGSTVSRSTLERHGWVVPKVRRKRPGRRRSSRTPEMGIAVVMVPELALGACA